MITAKFTTFEAAILEIVGASSEPLTTREIARRLEPRPRSLLGVMRTCQALERRGQLSLSLSLDGLENQWSAR